MVDRRGQLFQRYPCKTWYKNWYLHFYNTYDHQIWAAGISKGFDSNETNQTGADDVITSRSRDELKMTAKPGRMVTYLDGNLP